PHRAAPPRPSFLSGGPPMPPPPRPAPRSGSPRGNPLHRRMHELRTRALAAVTPEDLDQILQAIAREAKAGSVPAARLILEFTCGKAAPAVVPDEPEDADDLTDFELVRIIETALEDDAPARYKVAAALWAAGLQREAAKGQAAGGAAAAGAGAVPRAAAAAPGAGAEAVPAAAEAHEVRPTPPGDVAA